MIQFTSRVDNIANDLQNQIVQGKLNPGDRLPAERSLCVNFGVSRTTIREALKSLAVRGLITRRGRAVIVTDPKDASSQIGNDLASLAAQVNIKQLYEVRKLIEVRIAGWAAARATAEDIEQIRHSLELEGSRQNTNRSPNRNFHDALAAAAHNPALVRIYESGASLFFHLPFFWRLFDDAEVKTVRAGRHEMARRWHHYILKAIEERDATEAEGAMFQHLDLMEKDLLLQLRVAESDGEKHKLYSHPLLSELSTEKNDKLEKTRSTR